MLAANVPDKGTFWSSFAAQETVRACQRRSRCGVFRGCPVLSSFPPGPAPEVGHGIADICFAETLVLLIVAGIVSKVAHQEWSILLTTRVIFVTSAVNGQAGFTLVG